jgi:hypothetical protein
MVHWWVLVHSGAVLRVPYILESAWWQLYSVTAILKPPNLPSSSNLHKFHNPTPQYIPWCAALPIYTTNKKEKKRTLKQVQAHMVSLSVWYGVGNKAASVSLARDSFQCLQQDDLIQVYYTKQKWKKVYRRLSMYVQSNLCMGRQNMEGV